MRLRGLSLRPLAVIIKPSDLGMSSIVIQVLLSISFAVLSVLEDNIAQEFHFFLYLFFFHKSFHAVIVEIFFVTVELECVGGLETRRYIERTSVNVSLDLKVILQF